MFFASSLDRGQTSGGSTGGQRGISSAASGCGTAPVSVAAVFQDRRPMPRFWATPSACGYLQGRPVPVSAASASLAVLRSPGYFSTNFFDECLAGQSADGCFVIAADAVF